MLEIPIENYGEEIHVDSVVVSCVWTSVVPWKYPRENRFILFFGILISDSSIHCRAY